MQELVLVGQVSDLFLEAITFSIQLSNLPRGGLGISNVSLKLPRLSKPRIDLGGNISTLASNMVLCSNFFQRRDPSKPSRLRCILGLLHAHR